MKSLIFLALLAVAYAAPEADSNAEADPYYFYSNYYSHPGFYNSYYGFPSYRSYYGLPAYRSFYNYHYLYKRDAESQPESNAESDPYYYYTNHYVNPYYYGNHYYNAFYAQPHLYNTAYYTHAVPTVAKTVAVPQVATTQYVASPVQHVTYTKPVSYVAQTPGATHVVAKREAESNADAQWPGYYYGGPSYYRNYYGYNRYWGSPFYRRYWW